MSVLLVTKGLEAHCVTSVLNHQIITPIVTPFVKFVSLIATSSDQPRFVETLAIELVSLTINSSKYLLGFELIEFLLLVFNIEESKTALGNSQVARRAKIKSGFKLTARNVD